MILSILQLNINADNFWDKLISFLNSNDFDVLQFQEVTGKNTSSGNIKSKRDCYQELQKLLNDTYKSEIAIAQTYSSNPTTGYIANATFYKKDFKLITKQIVTLYERLTPFPSDATSYEEAGRNMLHLILEIDGKPISILNTHLAWAKTTIEQQHQTEQGKVLLEYLQTVESPFILTGDFNLDTKQPILRQISSFAQNLIDDYHVVNTLNPREHSAQMLFPPGAAVDYIFVTPDLKVNKFEVLDKEDLSDHLGLIAEIEI